MDPFSFSFQFSLMDEILETLARWWPLSLRFENHIRLEYSSVPISLYFLNVQTVFRLMFENPDSKKGTLPYPEGPSKSMIRIHSETRIWYSCIVLFRTAEQAFPIPLIDYSLGQYQDQCLQ